MAENAYHSTFMILHVLHFDHEIVSHHTWINHVTTGLVHSVQRIHAPAKCCVQHEYVSN